MSPRPAAARLHCEGIPGAKGKMGGLDEMAKKGPFAHAGCVYRAWDHSHVSRPLVGLFVEQHGCLFPCIGGGL